MGTITIDTTTQRFKSSPQPEADICVLHTTEGMSWPGYAGGGNAPHATIRAIPGKGIHVREHIPLNHFAKALVNLPGGVETNRRGALQYELMGTCDERHKGDKNWYYWPDADDVVLEALARYLKPKLVKYGIPFKAPEFMAYNRGRVPTSYGNSRVRFSHSQWNNFAGIVGHQHVPENSHGDPGAFPIAKLLKYLGAATKPAPQPTTTSRKLVEDGYWGPNTCKALQRWVGVTADGVMGRNTIKALQRKLGTVQDGVLGRNTTRALQRKVGASADGVWSRDRKSNTTLYLQRYLNKVLK